MTITTVRGTTTPIITPTTPTAPVAPTTTTPTATVTPTAGGTVPVAGGNVVNATKVAITGLGGVTNNAGGTASRFSRDATFDSYTGAGAGPVARGFIKCSAEPIAGGCRLNVQSFHAKPNDGVTLWLIAEVLDTKTNQMRTVTLSVLANAGNLNGSTYRGNNFFDISYEDVNKYLQARNPGLKITPGSTNFAVSARWASGHQAGGFARGGVFRLPVAPQTQSVVSIRAAGAAAATDEADLPLDMQVAFPAALNQQIPQLKTGGSIVSRLESELKGNTDKPKMVKAVHTMYALVEKAAKGDHKEVEKLLGKDWTVETVNRYWVKDDGSAGQAGSAGTGLFQGFRVDGDGLPLQDPMKDSYMDDGNLAMTRHEGAIRLRSNKQATVINVKPGGGLRDDKTAIAQRVEVGVELNAGANVADAAVALKGLQSGAFAGTVFNHAQKEVAKLDPTMNLANCLVPWCDVVQDRHKFTIKNTKTGVEVELSLDFVKATTTRPNHADASGKPKVVEFCTLEAELDHLQLASTNQSTFVAANTVATQHFTTDNDQDAWLKATSPQVTMDIDPRLHEIKDLQNKSFRSTTSYKAFEGVTAKLVPALFPQGLEFGRQKAAHAADLFGLVCFDDKKLMASVQQHIADGGFVVTPTLQAAIDAAFKDPAMRMRLETGISSGTARNVGAWLQASLGNVNGLEYDVAKAKTRLAGRLESLGFVADAASLAVFDNLAIAKLPPAVFEQQLVKMQSLADAQMLQGFAQSLGVTPTPVPKPDVKTYWSAAETQTAVKNNLDAAGVDVAASKEIEAFLTVAVAKGATMLELRQLVASLASQPQVRLQAIATARAVTPVPVLRASVDGLVRQLTPGMKAQFLEISPAVTSLLKKIAASRTHAEAQQIVTQMSSTAEATIAAEAKRLGTAMPKLDHDWVAIDAQLTPTLTAGSIDYDAGLQKLTRTAVDAGVPIANLKNAYSYMASMPPAQALKQAGIFLVGAVVPDVKFDVAALDALVKKNLAGYGAAVGNTQVFVAECLKAGLTPQQANQFATQSLTHGKTRAGQSVPLIPLTSLPNPPVDVAGYCAHQAQRFAAAWTPAIDAFVKANLDKALQASMALNTVWNQQPRNIVSYIASATGQAMPAGI